MDRRPVQHADSPLTPPGRGEPARTTATPPGRNGRDLSGARCSCAPIRSGHCTPMVVRTHVRYRRIMHPDLLDQLAVRHAVFTTTAMHMNHPADQYDGWRRDWAEVNRLVDEINRLVALHPRPPA